MTRNIVNIYHNRFIQNFEVLYKVCVNLDREELRLALEYDRETSTVVLKSQSIHSDTNWYDIDVYNKCGSLKSKSAQFCSESDAMKVAENLKKSFQYYRDVYVREEKERAYLEGKYTKLKEI